MAATDDKQPRGGRVALTLKTTPAVVRRMDALLGWAESQPEIVASGAATRADVHRAALAAGLDALERRAARAKG